MVPLLYEVDSIEQKDYSSDVQIVGFEESKEEKDDLKNLLKMCNKKMSINLKPADIKTMHRLGKRVPDKHRDLIVSFNDQKVREAVYDSRKKVAGNKDPSKNIYINDRITNHRKGLFYSARKLSKSKKMFAAWTQRGNVLIRKSEGGPVVQINNYRDLNMDQGADMGISSATCSNSETLRSHLSDYDFEDYDV